MNKKFALASLFCTFMTVFFIPPAHAVDQKFLNQIGGAYTLIGKQGTTDKTYTGTVDLIIGGGTIDVIRTVNGKQTKGTGTIEDSEKGLILNVEYDVGDDVMQGHYHILTPPQKPGIMSGSLLLNPPQNGDKWLETLFYQSGVDCEG